MARRGRCVYGPFITTTPVVVVFSQATRQQHRMMARVVKYENYKLRQTYQPQVVSSSRDGSVLCKELVSEQPRRVTAAPHPQRVDDMDIRELFRSFVKNSGGSEYPVKDLQVLCNSLLLPEKAVERRIKALSNAGVVAIGEDAFIEFVAAVEKDAEEGSVTSSQASL